MRWLFVCRNLSIFQDSTRPKKSDPVESEPLIQSPPQIPSSIDLDTGTRHRRRRCVRAPSPIISTIPRMARAETMRRRALYFITPSVGATLLPARLPRVVEAAIRGGADVVQWRQKPAAAALAAVPDLKSAWDASRANPSSFFLLDAAKEVRRITSKYGVPLIVNDSLELALEIQADGVHVGQTDAKIADLQQRLRAEGKQELIVGVTVRDGEQAQAACEGGATYLGAGPVFKSSSKPNANDGHTIGIEGLRECTAVAQKYGVPVYAIGGLSLADASIQCCISEGKAAGVSVIAAIGNADDVKAAAAAIRAALVEA